MKNLVLAITSYDRLNFLRDCIFGWDKTRDKSFNWTLIVADDGSDESVINFLDSIEITGVRVVIIKNNRNGISHQTNQIFKFLENDSFDLCFKVDNDFLFLQKGWESIYINAIQKYGYDHLTYENPNFNVGKWCKGGVLNEPVLRGDLIARVKSMYVKGCFYTVTPRIIEKVGYMDICNFFHGMEHIDFYLRCARAGFNDVRYPFDHIDSNKYLGYRFPWNKNQLSISPKNYKINGNSDNQVEKKKCIILDEKRIYIPYSEVARKMKDQIKVFI